MKFLDKLKNIFLSNDRYKNHSDAVIIACYFNPTNNPYRLKAFKIFFESIKHLNHRIVECVIGDSKPELSTKEFPTMKCTRMHTKNLLWHKETLLNNIIKDLPKEFKYVFWLDADIIFTNKNWLIEGVNQLKSYNLIQPFEYCVHLERDELEPSFMVDTRKWCASDPKLKHPKLWKSFASRHVMGWASSDNYDTHGHVGFAWGAKREVLDKVPLYDRALIGGADHIIAHAGAGEILHPCIIKSFTENLVEIQQWSDKFYEAVGGEISYVKGDLYHIWHGDIKDRQYLKRIQDFTSTINTITEKDENGLHTTDNDGYVKDYFAKREVKPDRVKGSDYHKKRAELINQYPDSDDSFIDSLIWGYLTDSSIAGTVIGGNPLGAIIGDMLNDDRPATEQLNDMLNDNQSDTTNHSQNDNFS